MRHEGIALPRREGGHPVRRGVPLVLEEDRKVVLGDAAEPHLAKHVFGDRHAVHPARTTALPTRSSFVVRTSGESAANGRGRSIAPEVIS